MPIGVGTARRLTRDKNARSRFELHLKSCEGGARQLVLTFRKATGPDQWRDTGPSLNIPPRMVDEILEMIEEGRRACIERDPNHLTESYSFHRIIGSGLFPALVA